MGPPPLKGIRVFEFAGLAPGPFTGLLLADYGASVLRIDRAISPGKGPDQPPVASDLLTRHKTSIAVNLKSTAGLQLIHALIQDVDVLIDPWRPGVLEKLGLAPETLLQLNDRLVIGRITGFRRDGKYAPMAGHDINYIAVSGVLSMLGKAKSLPSAPGNLLGDFAGGGAMCFMGILLALLSRATTGKGQVVESNMVDGSAYIATMPRLALKTPLWNQERGKNLLDGGCPYYDCYLTKDNKYMAVGALEPLFFTELLKGLSIEKSALSGNREDPGTWPELRRLFTSTFKSKSQSEWEQIFDGTDACCTPVRTHGDLEQIGFDQRPPVTLRDSPGLSISKNQTNSRPVHEGQGPGVNGEGWYGHVLKPDANGEVLLQTWTGWKKGRDYQDVDGGLVRLPAPRL